MLDGCFGIADVAPQHTAGNPRPVGVGVNTQRTIDQSHRLFVILLDDGHRQGGLPHHVGIGPIGPEPGVGETDRFGLVLFGKDHALELHLPPMAPGGADIGAGVIGIELDGFEEERQYVGRVLRVQIVHFGKA